MATATEAQLKYFGNLLDGKQLPDSWNAEELKARAPEQTKGTISAAIDQLQGMPWTPRNESESAAGVDVGHYVIGDDVYRVVWNQT